MQAKDKASIGERSAAKAYFFDVVAALRPRQWTKNLVCFAALVFADRLLDRPSFVLSTLGFVCFCLASSATYLFNDACDKDQDRLHPAKRHRPIASGRIGTITALILAASLALGSIVVSVLLGPSFRWVLAIYLILNILYTVWLKAVVIVDVMTIAAGFVLRVQSGIEAIHSPQSAWVVLCMFFMALFLGFGKRRGEMTNLQINNGHKQRLVLNAYSVQYLDILLGLSATTALVCYSLYAVTVQKNEWFLITILPVAFGIVRYLYLVIVRTEGEGPDEALTRDTPLVIAMAVWALSCVMILYWTRHPWLAAF